MILTGKCKEAFEKRFLEKEKKFDFYNKNNKLLNDAIQNALIIDFFDSVGIYIEIKNKFGQRKQYQRFSFIVKNYNSGFLFNSRTEAINAAVAKANEIFNNR